MTAGGVPSADRRGVRLSFSGSAAFDALDDADRMLSRVRPGTLQQVVLLARRTAAEVVVEPGRAHHSAAAAADAARVMVPRDAELARAYALAACCMSDLSASGLPHRLRTAEDLMNTVLAERAADLAPLAYFLRLSSLAEDGDVAALDRELSVRSRVARAFPELQNGRHAAWFRCMRATVDGRTDEAERLADEGRQTATAESDPDALIVWAGQLAIIRWMQSRVDEVESILLQVRQSLPDDPVWAIAVAWIWAKQGRGDAVDGILSSLPEVDRIPRDRNWLAALALLAEVVAEHGLAHTAEQVRRALRPFAHRLASIGLGITCWGVVARPLALLCLRLGDRDEARQMYQTAIEVSSRVGAQAWLAQAQCELAQILHEDGREPARVAELVSEASATAKQLGLREVAARAERLQASYREQAEAVPAVEAGAVRNDASRPDDPSRLGGACAGVPFVRVMGRFALTDAEGNLVVWRSRKAQTLLKLLASRSGGRVPRDMIYETLWPGENPSRLANRYFVALSTLRRLIDPLSHFDRTHFIDSDDESVALVPEHLPCDIALFLSDAREALDASGSTRVRAVSELVERFAPPFGEDLYADWAEAVREHAVTVFCEAAHVAEQDADARGDELARVTVCRRILTVDPYDARAHAALVAALEGLGAHGQAATARERARACFAELSLPSPV